MWKLFCITSVLLFSLPQLGNCQSPYKLDFKRESIIWGSSIGLAALTFPINDDLVPLTIDEINALNINDINNFDRKAIYNYSTTDGDISDVLLVSSILSPALLAISNDVRNDITPLLTMYFETLVLSALIPYFTKGITKRVRPFGYNKDVPLSQKLTKNAKRSFFSGHTTISFAMAVFLSTVYSDYYPDSKWKPVIWAGSLAIASIVGVLRYSSGSHFPTDVITGAIVGSAIGYFIPFIHRTDIDDLNFSLGANRFGSFINLNYQF